MDNKRLRKQLLLAAQDVVSGKVRGSCGAVTIRTNRDIRIEYSKTHGQDINYLSLWDWEQDASDEEALKLPRSLAILFFREYING